MRIAPRRVTTDIAVLLQYYTPPRELVSYMTYMNSAASDGGYGVYCGITMPHTPAGGNLTFNPLYREVKIRVTRSLIAGEWKPGGAVGAGGCGCSIRVKTKMPGTPKKKAACAAFQWLRAKNYFASACCSFSTGGSTSSAPISRRSLMRAALPDSLRK